MWVSNHALWSSRPNSTAWEAAALIHGVLESPTPRTAETIYLETLDEDREQIHEETNQIGKLLQGMNGDCKIWWSLVTGDQLHERQLRSPVNTNLEDPEWQNLKWKSALKDTVLKRLQMKI